MGWGEWFGRLLTRPETRKPANRRDPTTGEPVRYDPAGGRRAQQEGEGWIPVVSSWIAAINFSRYQRDNENSRGTLRIRTESGNTLVYVDVPADLWDDFFSSSSKGEFYNREIKGKFSYSRGR